MLGEPPGAVLGDFLVSLGRPEGVLGEVWERLGRPWKALGAKSQNNKKINFVFGGQNILKIMKNRFQKRSGLQKGFCQCF